MKIWYQSMTNLTMWDAYAKALHAVLDRVKDPGTELEVHGITKVGGIGDQYRYLEFLETSEVMENVHRAMERGFDAFLIGNIGEPGLKMAREVAEFPVLGLSESAAHMACMMGHSFSYVTINDKFKPRLLEQVDSYGVRSRCVGAFTMDIPRQLDLNEGFDGAKMRARIEADFDQAAAQGAAAGAEIVIPAGGVVMGLLAYWGVSRTKSGIPILDGITNLVKLGEMAVRVKQLTGQFTSKRANFAPPPADQIAELRKRYGDAIFPTVHPSSSK